MVSLVIYIVVCSICLFCYYSVFFFSILILSLLEVHFVVRKNRKLLGSGEGWEQKIKRDICDP